MGVGRPEAGATYSHSFGFHAMHPDSKRGLDMSREELLSRECFDRYNSAERPGRHDGRSRHWGPATGVRIVRSVPGRSIVRLPVVSVVSSGRLVTIACGLLLWARLFGPQLFETRVAADVIRLENGGELRGELLGAVTRTPGETISIRTLEGTRVEVSGDRVVLVARRPLKYEEYEARSERLLSEDDTVSGHWALAEWCRLERLPERRRVHLQRVVSLDPGHRQAHYGLGHTLRDGKWMSREAFMASRGLVRYRGRYMTPQRREDLEAAAVGADAYRKWFSRIRIWQKWLHASDANQQARGRSELGRVRDPAAIVPLVRILGRDDTVGVRVLLATVLGGIPDGLEIEPLVGMTLRDRSYEVRGAARKAIGPKRLPDAVDFAVPFLRDVSNVVVRRAAVLLGECQDVSAVPPLINALVTRHVHRVRVPGSRHPSFAFARDGTPVHPAVAQGFGVPPDVLRGMQMGQFPFGVVILPSQFAKQETQVISVVVDRENPEVLTALQRLTQHNGPGYDVRAWKLWWLAYRQGAK